MINRYLAITQKQDKPEGKNVSFERSKLNISTVMEKTVSVQLYTSGANDTQKCERMGATL